MEATALPSSFIGSTREGCFSASASGLTANTPRAMRDTQAAQLAKTFGCARYIYNQALEYRTIAWQQEKQSVGYHLTAAKLTEWKKEPEKAFLSEVSSVVLQQSLRNLDAAFTNFFAKRADYPKFKSKHGSQSVRYATNAFTYRDGQITLAKQSEPLDICWSRPLPDDAAA